MSDATRKYFKRYGVWCEEDVWYEEDMWYEEEVIVVKEGDKCPECGEGVMKVSKIGNLYCSEDKKYI